MARLISFIVGSFNTYRYFTSADDGSNSPTQFLESLTTVPQQCAQLFPLSSPLLSFKVLSLGNIRRHRESCLVVRMHLSVLE
jgi:hypothetical protein